MWLLQFYEWSNNNPIAIVIFVCIITVFTIAAQAHSRILGAWIAGFFTAMIIVQLSLESLFNFLM